MLDSRHIVFAAALLLAFGLSLVLTSLARNLALRLGLLDHPGERKMHQSPVPVGGGVAIFISFILVLASAILVLRALNGSYWLTYALWADLGYQANVKVVGLVAGASLIFILGVIDDRRALRPEAKLFGQIVAALILVLCGMRIELFVLSNYWLSALVTVLWVVTVTNALNFLDNMDGLAGGVSIIAAFSFFLAVQPPGEFLDRLVLMTFAGAVGGFLYHNLKSRIFMGDAGSMFCGFMLASVAIAGTFHVSTNRSPMAVAAPLLALSVPLFDSVTVVLIRWRSGQSIMKGDKRHFSHRLVDLGMTPRQAVGFICLVAAVTGLGAALLSHVGVLGTVIILAQTLGLYLLIVILMVTGKRAIRRTALASRASGERE